MAITALSNIFEPRLFNQYTAEEVTKKSALMNSGAVVSSDLLNTLAAQAGSTADLPHFSEFSYVSPDVAKDTTDVATPANVATGIQITQKDYLSKSFAEATLAVSASGEDILGHVVDKVVAPYWVNVIQESVLAKVSGVIKDNIANDSGDMVIDVSTDGAGAIAAGESANVNTIIDARGTMGDRQNDQMIMFVHSTVYANLMKLEPTSFQPASELEPFVRYNGMIILMDDDLPAVAGTNRTVYTSYLLGAGSIAMGEANLGEESFKYEENALQGNGWGTKSLTSKKQFIIHPTGFASSATVTSGSLSPTLAQYDTATAWNRVVSRKNAKIVALKTNA